MISDWHAHLDLTENPIRYAEVICNKVEACFCVTTSPKAWTIAKNKFSKFDNIKVALGFHPELAKAKMNELSLFERCSLATRYIGEIGLDYKASNWDYQIKSFSKITDILSVQKDKIISIHSRNADSYIFEYLKLLSKNNVIIMHWFSGSNSFLMKCIDLGCYFSINPAMCKTKSGEERIRLIPLTRMVFESDFPFSTVNNVMIQPSNLYRVIYNVSEILSLNKSIIIENERNNSQKLLSSG